MCMMKSRILCLCLMPSILGAQGRDAPPAEPLKVLGSIPIREVTVFKDGHAFVVHEGTMPVNAAGDVVIDELPQPVLGTFWPYSGGKPKLAATTAGKRRVIVDRTALDVRSLLEANPGAEVIFVDNQGRQAGVVLGVPARTAEELMRTDPPGEQLPQKGSVILVKTAEGIRAAPIDGIKEVTFRGECKRTLGGEEFRNLLTLDLDWGGQKPEATASVGMGYVQRGLRWIPAYHVTIDGAGKAKVKLEATLVNDLADLENVIANLVIGVPTFDFKGMLDPISLQTAMAPVARNLDRDAQGFLSNALMSQRISFPADEAAPAGSGPSEPEVSGSVQNEDLFVFTVKNVTLRRGARMVVPVAEFELPYKDVYTLDVEFGPPAEVRGNLDAAKQEELARKLGESKVVHKLRLTNKSAYPLTTAPALLVSNGKLLAQSTMTFTSIGGEVDLPVTAAVDIKAKRTDKETGRTPDAAKWNDNSFNRIDLTGTLEITNYKDKPVVVEVSREVLGTLDSATPDGSVAQMSLEEYWSGGWRTRWWWHWYGWPGWWSALNGVGSAKWTVTVEPKKPVTLVYKWHYFWR